MSDNFATASVTIKPSPEPDERAFATDGLLHDALRREDAVDALDRLPVPSSTDFWRRVSLHAHEMSDLTPQEAVTTAARREVKVDFRLHPRRAAFHRRFNTRRWRFARDGALRGAKA